jgi:phosphohistidine phosphatase SixA
MFLVVLLEVDLTAHLLASNGGEEKTSSLGSIKRLTLTSDVVRCEETCERITRRAQSTSASAEPELDPTEVHPACAMHAHELTLLQKT